MAIFNSYVKLPEGVPIDVLPQYVFVDPILRAAQP